MVGRDVVNLISLREFLIKNPNKLIQILPLIYTYINSFLNEYSFIHGNLHIDNIYTSPYENNIILFYVIDFVNSYSIYNNYNFKEYDSKKDLLEYWDSFTFYSSIMMFLENTFKFSQKKLENIKKLIHNLIKKNKNEIEFIKKYNKYIKIIKHL